MLALGVVGHAVEEREIEGDAIGSTGERKRCCRDKVVETRFVQFLSHGPANVRWHNVVHELEETS